MRFWWWGYILVLRRFEKAKTSLKDYKLEVFIIFRKFPKMLNRKNKLLLLKVLSLFSVVRGIIFLLLLLLAQLFGIHLYFYRQITHCDKFCFDVIYFASLLPSVNGNRWGLHINNFYDAEKDLIK